MNIIDFSTHIGFNLFPVQKVVLKAAYGLALDAQQTFSVLIDPEQEIRRDFTEVSYLGYLFAEGRSSIEHVRLGLECRELVLALGRRSGKSVLSGLIATYELYRLLEKPDPHAYFGLSPNSPLHLTLLSTDKEQAHHLLKETTSFWKACPEIVTLNTEYNTMSYSTFVTKAGDKETPNKYLVKLQGRSARGLGLKGAGNLLVIFDEMAYYASDKGQDNGHEIYTALAPSTSSFVPKNMSGGCEGKLVCISTPSKNSSNGFNLKARHALEEPQQNCLCLNIPTWEMNPQLTSFKHPLDIESATVEFGAFLHGTVHSKKPGLVAETLHLLDAAIRDSKWKVSFRFHPVTQDASLTERDIRQYAVAVSVRDWTSQLRLYRLAGEAGFLVLLPGNADMMLATAKQIVDMLRLALPLEMHAQGIEDCSL